jgi:TfoX/Sxy family transcriptional regulator of competence genes
MAYDEELAERLRERVLGESGAREKRMFGGVGFLINGNLAVSASGQGGLLLRVQPSDTEAFVTEPHAERFEMRGRAMNGWLRIAAQGVASDDDFERWVHRGVSYARSLPPK